MGNHLVTEHETSEFAFPWRTLGLQWRGQFQDDALGCSWPIHFLVCGSGGAHCLHGFPELVPTGYTAVPTYDSLPLQKCPP